MFGGEQERGGLGDTTLVLTLFGYSVFAFLFFGALWRHACRWRLLAQVYAGESGRPLAKRTMQNAVLLGLGAFNSLKGILTIAVHETGVSFRVMKPFSLFHTPLFIPYKDIRGWESTWYLDAPSTELQFIRAPGVKMVMPAEQADWIRSFSGQKMELRNAPPPNGKAGQGWRAFILANLTVIIGMSIILLAFMLSR